MGLPQRHHAAPPRCPVNRARDTNTNTFTHSTTTAAVACVACRCTHRGSERPWGWSSSRSRVDLCTGVRSETGSRARAGAGGSGGVPDGCVCSLPQRRAQARKAGHGGPAGGAPAWAFRERERWGRRGRGRGRRQGLGADGGVEVCGGGEASRGWGGWGGWRPRCRVTGSGASSCCCGPWGAAGAAAGGGEVEAQFWRRSSGSRIVGTGKLLLATDLDCSAQQWITTLDYYYVFVAAVKLGLRAVKRMSLSLSCPKARAVRPGAVMQYAKPTVLVRLNQAPRKLCPSRVALPAVGPISRRSVAVAASSQPAAPATDSNIGFRKGFWTFIDVVAILGSVGGALAAILNLFSGTYVLFLPLILPVISLLAALQREGLIAEVRLSRPGCSRWPPRPD